MSRRIMLVAGLLVLAAGLAAAQTLEPMRSGVIPVAAHQAGADGSYWTTDLYATQKGGSSPGKLTLTVLMPSGPDYSKTFTFPAAGGTLEIEDIVRAVAPTAADGKYVVTWWATQDTVVSTRTFTTEAKGTYGQGVASLAPGTGFQQDGEAIFPVPMDFDGHRVNVGIANGGASAQTFTIRALSSTGSELASWTRTVQPGSVVQIRVNDGMTGAGSVALVCTEGCDGNAYGYASVVTNGTSDAYFLYAGARAGDTTYAPIAMSRDDRGVWYITGGSLYDVFRAMGYAVASDRLWQMELYRRTARGTMAEVFGPSYLENDIFMRTAGYSEQELEAAFAAMDADSKTVLQGYVDGINARIAELAEDPSQLPFEFKALGAQLGTQFFPAAWTTTDVMAWVATLQRNFDPEGRGGTGQLDNVALLQAFAAAYPGEYQAMFQDLRWRNDPHAITYVHDGAKDVRPSTITVKASSFPDLRQVAPRLHQRFDRRIANLKKINAFTKMGSYAWVVSGHKTASGRPIVYSGPQMGFSTPSIVMEGSIRGGGLNISGMTVPGVPSIIIGRTPHHAWSMQVGHAHTFDFYLEAPEAVSLHRMETIHVAGGSDVTIPVFRTPHGPVIEPIPYDPTNPPDVIISFKYAHWGYELDFMKFALKAARAQSVDEFGEAIEAAALSQHFCYADRDGNIAYWMSGRDPVRPEGVDVRFPLIGDGTQEWSAEELIPRSHDRNTEVGYYGGWNNKSRADYDNPPNNHWYQIGIAHRAQVIEDYLSTHDDLTFEQVRDLALNIATTDSFGGGGNTWAFVADRFKAAVAAHPTSDRQAAIQLLDAWDGHFVDGGEAAWASGLFRADAWVLQDAWIREVIRLTFEDEFEGAGLKYTDEPMGLLFNVLLHALAGESSGVVNLYDWFQDRSGMGKPESPDLIIVQALDNVQAALGNRPYLAARGYIRYVHPMLGEIHTTPFSSRSTYAHVVEYGPEGPVRIESMFPLGESGTILMDETGAPIFDPHFFSMAPLFDAFTHRSFPLFD